MGLICKTLIITMIVWAVAIVVVVILAKVILHRFSNVPYESPTTLPTIETHANLEPSEEEEIIIPNSSEETYQPSRTRKNISKKSVDKCHFSFYDEKRYKKVMRKRSTHRHLKENDIHRLRDVIRACRVEGSF